MCTTFTFKFQRSQTIIYAVLIYKQCCLCQLQAARHEIHSERVMYTLGDTFHAPCNVEALFVQLINDENMCMYVTPEDSNQCIRLYNI